MKRQNLSVLACNNGFTLWHYVTDEVYGNLADYFNEVAAMLRARDVIEFSYNGGHVRLLVTDIEQGRVRVQPL